MSWFTSLDPQLQGAVIGGGITGAIAVFLAILGGLGWLITYRIQVGARKKDLRRIKLQHVMERLIEVHDWVGSEEKPGSHPADHILWLCEAYGGSDKLTAAATSLRDACDQWVSLSMIRHEEMTEELQERIDSFNELFSEGYEDTRMETLRLLRELSGVK